MAVTDSRARAVALINSLDAETVREIHRELEARRIAASRAYQRGYSHGKTKAIEFILENHTDEAAEEQMGSYVRRNIKPVASQEGDTYIDGYADGSAWAFANSDLVRTGE